MNSKKVWINGRETIVNRRVDFSYSHLCTLAGRDPRQPHTVTWSLPDGRCGEITAGQRAPFENGAVYNVMVCGAV